MNNLAGSQIITLNSLECRGQHLFVGPGKRELNDLWHDLDKRLTSLATPANSETSKVRQKLFVAGWNQFVVKSQENLLLTVHPQQQQRVLQSYLEIKPLLRAEGNYPVFMSGVDAAANLLSEEFFDEELPGAQVAETQRG